MAVLPPNDSDNAGAGPAFTRTHYRLRTVPAPWSDRERWRRAEDGDMEDGAAAELAALPADTNVDELDIWVDVAELDGLAGDPSRMIGMGLRGRWAEISAGREDQMWWIVRLKDCKWLWSRENPINRGPEFVATADDPWPFFFSSGHLPCLITHPAAYAGLPCKFD